MKLFLCTSPLPRNKQYTYTIKQNTQIYLNKHVMQLCMQQNSNSFLGYAMSACMNMFMVRDMFKKKQKKVAQYAL